MEVNQQSRRNIKIQNITFVVLFIAAMALLGWITQRYNFEADWTAAQRNTLSNATITLLQKINGNIKITAFAREGDISQQRRTIKELVNKYKKYKPDIKLTFINPETDPATTRKLGIRVEGEMIVELKGRSEHVQNPQEQALTNTLQRLMRSGTQTIRFLTNHGERNPSGKANHDYQIFTDSLKTRGLNFATLNLAETHAIPTDTAALVIAGPQVDYLQGEVKLIENYIRKGGNLLWLHDPGPMYKLEPVAKLLGIEFIKGVVVDPTTQLLGISATSAFAERYAQHAITQGFTLGTLYPQAGGIQSFQDEKSPWQVTDLIKSSARSWLETGKLEGTVEFNAGIDTPGPIVMGIVMERDKPGTRSDTGATGKNKDKPAKTNAPKPKQRIVIIADGDFISNAYLGNLGNQDLGHRILNWISNDDTFITIPAKVAPDTKVQFDKTIWAVIGLFFLVGLPIIFIASGIIIWLKRRNR